MPGEQAIGSQLVQGPVAKPVKTLGADPVTVETGGQHGMQRRAAAFLHMHESHPRPVQLVRREMRPLLDTKPPAAKFRRAQQLELERLNLVIPSCIEMCLERVYLVGRGNPPEYPPVSGHDVRNADHRDIPPPSSVRSSLAALPPRVLAGAHPSNGHA